jgi:WhiB family redox-sensing transcriptional regulator
VNPAEVAWLISGEQSDPSAWLAELTRRPSWHADAACRGADPAAFILARGANAAVMARARAVCAVCTVTEQCLSFALADPDAMGVWGGTTAQQRRAMRAGRVA